MTSTTSDCSRDADAGWPDSERGGSASAVRVQPEGGWRSALPDEWETWEAEVAPARLQHFFERTVDRTPQAVASRADERIYTYAELDALANRLAHLLVQYGLEPGSRVGILLQRSSVMYVSLLAVLKAGGTFVPIDPASPADRVRYIVEDAQLSFVLTSAQYAALAEPADAVVLDVERLGSALEQMPEHRVEVRDEDDPVCYIIYTSGSTGRPKGVEVAHSSICNFHWHRARYLRRSPRGPGLPGHDDRL